MGLFQSFHSPSSPSAFPPPFCWPKVWTKTLLLQSTLIGHFPPQLLLISLFYWKGLRILGNSYGLEWNCRVEPAYWWETVLFNRSLIGGPSPVLGSIKQPLGLGFPLCGCWMAKGQMPTVLTRWHTLLSVFPIFSRFATLDCHLGRLHCTALSSTK